VIQNLISVTMPHNNLRLKTAIVLYSIVGIHRKIDGEILDLYTCTLKLKRKFQVYRTGCVCMEDPFL